MLNLVIDENKNKAISKSFRNKKSNEFSVSNYDSVDNQFK